MKKLPLWVGMAVGALIGLFTSIPDGVGLKIVMMSIGALAGAAVGGAIARFGKKGRALKSADDALAGLGVTPEDLARNYWRDKGRPPLTSPLEPEHGHHQFDPDKL
jgi:hypothetical protein